MRSKVGTKEDILALVHDGMTMSFSDIHGQYAPDELIAAMLEKGVKDLTVVSISGGNPKEGVGLLIKNHCVKKLITTHTALNPLCLEQLKAGELEIEYCPMGTWIERQHAAAAGLGGVLTPTGVGTEVEEGKQKLTLNGKEYILEMPIPADLAIIKAWRADTAGNVCMRLNGVTGHDTMALAAKQVVFEVEDIVEVGELGPDQITIPAPITTYVYARTGEKRYMSLPWQAAKARAEGGTK